jgi:hypothetical protein
MSELIPVTLIYRALSSVLWTVVGYFAAPRFGFKPFIGALVGFVGDLGGLIVLWALAEHVKINPSAVFDSSAWTCANCQNVNPENLNVCAKCRKLRAPAGTANPGIIP